MGISKASDYAILVVGYLSSHPEGEIKSKSDIARNLLLPEEFLSKILQKLAKKGIISSTKGVKGGYQLQKSPDQLTFLDVIEGIEGKINIVDCLSEDFEDCGRQSLCTSIMRKMAMVEVEISNVLRSMNFSDITVPVSPVV